MLQNTKYFHNLCGNLTQQWNKTSEKPKWVPHLWQALWLQHLIQSDATQNRLIWKLAEFVSVLWIIFLRQKNKNLRNWKIWVWGNITLFLLPLNSLAPCCQWLHFTWSIQHKRTVSSNRLCLFNAAADPKIYLWLATLYEACEILQLYLEKKRKAWHYLVLKGLLWKSNLKKKKLNRL